MFLGIRRRVWMAALVLALAVSGAGCSGGSQHSSATPATTSAPASKSPGRTMRFQLAAAGSTPETVHVPNQPLGTTPASAPGVDLQVYVMQRVSPSAVLVVFALHIGGSTGAGNDDMLLSANSGGNTVSAVSIVDPAGLKQYLTFMADPTNDSTCLCSSNFAAATQGDVDYFAALVAAPPRSVTTVNFQTPVGTIAGVPLSG